MPKKSTAPAAAHRAVAASLPGFVSSFKQSFWTPDFYKKIPAMPFSHVLKYLFGLTLIIYVVVLAALAVPFAQNRAELSTKIDSALSAFPPDLVLTVQDGKLSSNQTSAVFLPSSPIFPATDAPEKYLVVIDTETPFSQEQYQNYNALVWLTADTAYVGGRDQQMRLIPYPKDANQVLDKTTGDALLLTVWGKIKQAIALIAIFGLIFMLGGIFVAYIFALLGITLLTLLFAFLVGRRPSFSDIYKSAVYALTPAWSLTVFLLLLSPLVTIMMPLPITLIVVLATLYFNTRDHLLSKVQTPSHTE